MRPRPATGLTITVHVMPAEGSETSVQTRLRAAAARGAAIRSPPWRNSIPRGSTLRATVPKHVAIVMDGNGRWAQRRGLKRTEGHAAGEEALFDTVEGALEIGLEWLTVYAFSTENWRRPLDEVRFLMNFNERLLVARRDELQRQGRAGAVHRPPHAAGCRAACCAASRRPRR